MSDETVDPGPEILDVNHYDSHVLVRFENGVCVKLSAQQLLDAADRAAAKLVKSDEKTTPNGRRLLAGEPGGQAQRTSD